MYNNILTDQLFTNELVSAQFDDIDISKILGEFDSIQSDNESKDLSNMGGYHTPTYHNESSGFSELDKLAKEAKEFLYDFLDEKDWKYYEFRSAWWGMRNVAGNYNVLHHHCKADFIALFYPKVPDNSGDFVIMRNDGIAYSPIFNRNSQCYFYLKPEVGRFYLLPGHLWHHVEASNTTDDRVCIAYNFYEMEPLP